MENSRAFRRQVCARSNGVGIIEALSLPPILRGFLVLLAAGALFPLAGVFVLRLNLITLRFALMHGALLGGAVGLAAGVNPLWPGIAANMLLVLIVSRGSRSNRLGAGMVTTVAMVVSAGAAFALLYRYNVPAKDALDVLWGNIYALTTTDALITLAFGLFLAFFVALQFRPLLALLFDRDVARASGVNIELQHTVVLFVVAATVAFTMRLIGALLLDALLILPGLVATLVARSTRALFVLSGVFGLMSAGLGFPLSVWLNIPASSAVTLCGAGLLGLAYLRSRIVRH